MINEALMNANRKEFLGFCREKVSGSAYAWITNVVSSISKKFQSTKNDTFKEWVEFMYCNINDFFREYVTEVTDYGIVLTTYMCAIELGVKEFGDFIEEDPVFFNNIDMEDWKTMDLQTLENFDAGMCDQLIKRVVKNESYTVDITACGLYTLKFIGLSKLK